MHILRNFRTFKKKKNPLFSFLDDLGSFGLFALDSTQATEH
jgi:hypothetical protein